MIYYILDSYIFSYIFNNSFIIVAIIIDYVKVSKTFQCVQQCNKNAIVFSLTSDDFNFILYSGKTIATGECYLSIFCYFKSTLILSLQIVIYFLLTLNGRQIQLRDKNQGSYQTASEITKTTTKTFSVHLSQVLLTEISI